MSIEPLDWFPKRFGPGDMDGTGGDRLLGRSQLSPLEILVRETAQNSWDARCGTEPPVFGVSLRRTSPALRSDLVRLLGRGRTESLQRRERDQHLRVLEIFDRGTRGLDGPVDLTPARLGEEANYQDLILKVGVATHDGVGGGTYGFGKTAAFAYSRLGTVVYWTRCRNSGGDLEHRLIVSAIQESYTERSIQFTGRHWWGVVEGDSILPVRGEAAEAIGGRLFERGFDGEETGTSVLVLDPSPLTDSSADEETSSEPVEQAGLFAQQSRSAIRMHLWPKLIPQSASDRPPMDVRLRVDGADIPLIDEPAGALSLWAAGLDAVRAAQQQRSVSRRAPRGARVEVFPITRSARGRTATLGHLALVQHVVGMGGEVERDDLDPSLPDARLDRICLMRSDAELVVTTAPWFERSLEDGTEWFAVYKPTPEFDGIYAESEPPAHDDWVSSGAEDEVAKIIRHTRNKVKRTLRDQLFPDAEPVEAASGEAEVESGDLARRLGTLLPSAGERLEISRGGRDRRPGSSRAAGPGVVASAPYLVGTAPDGAQQQRIGFRVIGGPVESIVVLEVSQVGDQGMREPVPARLLNIRWSGAAQYSAVGRAVTARDADCWVEFFGPPRRALRIELRTEAS